MTISFFSISSLRQIVLSRTKLQERNCKQERTNLHKTSTKFKMLHYLYPVIMLVKSINFSFRQLCHQQSRLHCETTTAWVKKEACRKIIFPNGHNVISCCTPHTVSADFVSIIFLYEMFVFNSVKKIKHWTLYKPT